MKRLTFLLSFLAIIFLILTIVYQVKEEYQPQSTDPMLLRVKDKLRLIYPNIDRLEFYEADKSYTINKRKVHLCLRDENNNYYNENMLVYVALHELAHVLCDEIGHTDKFHKIFQDLIDKAYEIGIYDPSIPIIQNYCGHT